MRIIVPPVMSKTAITVFKVRGSPKNTTDNKIAIATLALSTGATCDTFPNCSALK
ncbi:hypothetical protein D3C86_849450 [compost metagenome]